MLTEIQKGMIRYCLQWRINQLLHYFSRIGRVDNPYKEITQIVQNAFSNQYGDRDYTVSSEQCLLGSKKIEIIKCELNGIFNPNMTILAALGIINSTRDSMKITADNFHAIVPDIMAEARAFAHTLLQKDMRFSSYLDRITAIDPPASVPIAPFSQASV